MNKSDLREWTRDMLETEIINMNAKNFLLQNEVNNLRESNRKLKAQIESSKIQFNENENKNKYIEKQSLFYTLFLNYLSRFNCPSNVHGYYYEGGGEKYEKTIYFTEGIGFHDGTGRKVVLR